MDCVPLIVGVYLYL